MCLCSCLTFQKAGKSESRSKNVNVSVSRHDILLLEIQKASCLVIFFFFTRETAPAETICLQMCPAALSRRVEIVRTRRSLSSVTAFSYLKARSLSNFVLLILFSLEGCSSRTSMVTSWWRRLFFHMVCSCVPPLGGEVEACVAEHYSAPHAAH